MVNKAHKSNKVNHPIIKPKKNSNLNMNMRSYYPLILDEILSETETISEKVMKKTQK